MRTHQTAPRFGLALNHADNPRQPRIVHQRGFWARKERGGDGYTPDSLNKPAELPHLLLRADLLSQVATRTSCSRARRAELEAGASQCTADQCQAQWRLGTTGAKRALGAASASWDRALRLLSARSPPPPSTRHTRVPGPKHALARRDPCKRARLQRECRGPSMPTAPVAATRRATSSPPSALRFLALCATHRPLRPAG